MTKCTACEFEATHIPRLVFVAFKGAGAAVMFVDRPSCRQHLPSVAELISDEEWRKITLTIVSAGKLIPKRELTTVEYVPLRGHEAQAFYKALKGASAGQDVLQITTPTPDTKH